MTEQEDIDLLAAEYVLGTLDAEEREAVDARQHRDAGLARAIADWQRRLAPLDELVLPVTPAANLFARIEARLNARAERNDAISATIISLQRRVRVWRSAAVAVGAIAAALALVVGFRDTLFLPPPQNFVAVFHRGDEQPSFLMSIDLSTRELTVRPITAQSQPGRTYQLWIASDQLGPAPRSLGLLDQPGEPTSKTLTEFDRDLLQKATFGISLEPEGGSPTGQPTSPALHGTLYPARP